MDKMIFDNGIQCEDCYRLFYYPLHISLVIDADGYDEVSKSVKSGLINRVVCPYCGAGFTFEAPVLIFSLIYKIAVIAGFGDDELPSGGNLPNALKISGCDDLKLRTVDFSSEAAEKIRIVSAGFDDIKLEMLKLKYISGYKDMDPTDEYITFEMLKNSNLIFTHRDFMDNVISEIKIPVEKYNAFNPKIPKIKNGEWFKADKKSIINYMNIWRTDK